LECRQRKIKCNRRFPCSNCVRTSRQCSFVAPVRGKRKKRTLPKEGLHAKLRRYEELLKAYGAKIEPSNDGSMSDAETLSDIGDERKKEIKSHDKHNSSALAFDDTNARLIAKDGSSRYLEK
jgi:hypothetical protein